MKFDKTAPGAENLAAAGINQLMGKKLLTLDRMPLPHLHWFSYPGTNRPCVAITSTIGYITIMYGVRRKFVELADLISDENAGRVISSFRGYDTLDFCRAYIVAEWQPGPYAFATLTEAGGSGRAANELKPRRAPPVSGVFFKVDDGKPSRKPINVGLTLYGDGRADFVNFDVGVDAVLRPLTAEELAYTKGRVMNNDEIAALYYTAEARHGLH